MHRIEIDGCTLVRTCHACPEQYDVFRGGQQIGYLRLRHGAFRADYGECGGPTVYQAAPRGYGCFDDDERDDFLSEAINALMTYHRA